MDLTVLEDLGLTRAEIKIYVALLELGSTKAGAVLKRTGLQNSVVHLTLAKLVEKGLISFVCKGRVRHYQAGDPHNILRFLDEKRARLSTLIPLLVDKQVTQERQEAEVFEGLPGLKSMLYQLIEPARRGDEYLFFSFYTPNENDYQEVFSFYEEFERERIQRGIIVKGIARSVLKKRLTRRRAGSVVFVDFPIIQNVSVFQNKVIMTPWDERQVSFLATSSQLAENFRQYFYSVWNSAKHR